MKIIITEQEKRNIRQLYGLIVENDSAELLDYANNYIDTHSCDTIYENLLSFQNAVNSGNPKMSNKDKQELSKNLKDMKSYKDWFCDTVKEKMKERFQEESKNNPENLKTYMCWFSTNVTKTNLKPCKPKSDPVQPSSGPIQPSSGPVKPKSDPVQPKVNTIPTNNQTPKSNDRPIRQDDLNPNVDDDTEI
jgi:hypothetical protein